jgi:hypothetical protein
MADQNHFERSINAGSTPVQSISNPVGLVTIATAPSTVSTDMSVGDYKIALPSAASSAGETVTVVIAVAGGELSVGPSGSDTIDGSTASVAVGSTVYDSASFVSLGGTSWVQL